MLTTIIDAAAARSLPEGTEVLLVTTNGGSCQAVLTRRFTQTYAAWVKSGAHDFCVGSPRIKWLAHNVDVRGLIHPFLR